MNPIFNICNSSGHRLRIQDLSQEADEYVPEEVADHISLLNRYYNNKYKYSQTCTINIIEYSALEEKSILKTMFTDHSSHLDETFYNLEKDGHYTVHHFILPTVEWLEEELNYATNILKYNRSIYVTDGYKIYYYADGELIEKDPKVLIEINIEDSTISKCVKDTFSICYLYECYISLCKEIFNNSTLKCLNRNINLQDLIFKRDFLWMTINVLEYYAEFGQLREAQRILETVNYCGTFCQSTRSQIKSSGCGCNK